MKRGKPRKHTTQHVGTLPLPKPLTSPEALGETLTDHGGSMANANLQIMNIENIKALHAIIAASSIFRTDGATIDLAAALIALADAVHALDHTDDATEHIWHTIGEYTECPLGDLIIGAYWALSQWHGGQTSDTYAALCALGQVFNPGMTSGPELGTSEEMVYDSINQHFEKVESRRKKSTHEYYNTENFPILVAHHGPWDIYRNENDECAAIPLNPNSGYAASHFGTMNYVRTLAKEDQTLKLVK